MIVFMNPSQLLSHSNGCLPYKVFLRYEVQYGTAVHSLLLTHSVLLISTIFEGLKLQISLQLNILFLWEFKVLFSRHKSATIKTIAKIVHTSDFDDAPTLCLLLTTRSCRYHPVRHNSTRYFPRLLSTSTKERSYCCVSLGFSVTDQLSTSTRF